MLEVYLMDSYERVRDLEAQAVLDTCLNKEECALCPSIARDVRKFDTLTHNHQSVVTMLLLNKIRKDFYQIKEDYLRDSIASDLEVAAKQAAIRKENDPDYDDVDPKTLSIAASYVRGKG
jgi:hypothetical protein